MNSWWFQVFGCLSGGNLDPEDHQSKNVVTNKWTRILWKSNLRLIMSPVLCRTLNDVLIWSSIMWTKPEWMCFPLSLSTGGQHHRETRVFESRREDQLVSHHGEHRLKGNSTFSEITNLWAQMKKTAWLFCLNHFLQVKTPVVNTKSKVLVPGLPGHQAPLKGSHLEKASEKRKKDTKEVSACAPVSWLLFPYW